MINKDLLADLDDLDEDSPIQEEQNEDDQEIKPEQYGVDNVASQKYSKLLTVHREKFLAHINKITNKIDSKIQGQMQQQKQQQRGQIIQDIDKCNHYVLQINKQTASISKFIKKAYYKRFPELQSIINNEAQYCRALIDIEEQNIPKNKNQIQQQNPKPMFWYLSPQQRISLQITKASSRDSLPKQQHQQVISAAKVVLQLQNHKQILMIYLQTCMQLVAPNLCQLVGSVIASKLIATAGGLDKLAAMPACNIQVMGGTRAAQIGMSQLQRNHTGVFGQMDVVKDAPGKFQIKLVRMLATNTAKCARADFLGSNNGQGARLRDEMYQRFQKVQEEGGLMRIDRPLEIPDSAPKKKRGGKRHRKNKQLYEMSELRKNQNRVKFGEAEEEIQQGEGLGMIKNTGKIKTSIKKQKLKVSKKMQQRAQKKSGLQSNLNISARQGIQLMNPALKQQANKSKGTDSYFAKESGFRTVLNNKLGK